MQIVMEKTTHPNVLGFVGRCINGLVLLALKGGAREQPEQAHGYGDRDQHERSRPYDLIPLR